MVRGIILLILLVLSFNALGFKATVTAPIYSPMAENIQGITQTEDFWFISNQYNIYRVPKNKRLIPQNFYPNIINDYPTIKIPKHLRDLGYNHFGGITIYKSYLVVALERISPMKLLFFDIFTLEHMITYNVPSTLESLSWVASNGEKIYFSQNRLDEYSPLYELSLEENTLIKTFIPAKISRIQGGTISSGGKTLFLASDQGSRVGGIYSIDLKNLKVKHEIGIIYNRGFPAYQEIEGLTLNSSDHPSKITLLLLDNNIVEDSFHFIEVSDFIDNPPKQI